MSASQRIPGRESVSSGGTPCIALEQCYGWCNCAQDAAGNFLEVIAFGETYYTCEECSESYTKACATRVRRFETIERNVERLRASQTQRKIDEQNILLDRMLRRAMNSQWESLTVEASTQVTRSGTSCNNVIDGMIHGCRQSVRGQVNICKERVSQDISRCRRSFGFLCEVQNLKKPICELDRLTTNCCDLSKDTLFAVCRESGITATQITYQTMQQTCAAAFAFAKSIAISYATGQVFGVVTEISQGFEILDQVTTAKATVEDLQQKKRVIESLGNNIALVAEGEDWRTAVTSIERIAGELGVEVIAGAIQTGAQAVEFVEAIPDVLEGKLSSLSGNAVQLATEMVSVQRGLAAADSLRSVYQDVQRGTKTLSELVKAAQDCTRPPPHKLNDLLGTTPSCQSDESLEKCFERIESLARSLEDEVKKMGTEVGRCAKVVDSLQHLGT